jgi:hypothetical protein
MINKLENSKNTNKLLLATLADISLSIETSSRQTKRAKYKANVNLKFRANLDEKDFQ